MKHLAKKIAMLGAPDFFIERPKTKSELIAFFSQENPALANESLDFIFMYSSSCYDDCTAPEISSYIDYFLNKTPEQKYKSYCEDSMLLLLVRPQLLEDTCDYGLVREAITYFDSAVYIGYMTTDRTAINLP